MVLQSVLSSKLYHASSRQAQILAAMEAAKNIELVTQLSNHLRDDLQTAERSEDIPERSLDEVETVVDSIGAADEMSDDSFNPEEDYADSLSSDEVVNDEICDDLEGAIVSALQDAGCGDAILRTRLTASEMWVYCKDAYNLDSVLPQILYSIDTSSADNGLLNSVHFNRLARTENAVVLDVTRGE